MFDPASQTYYLFSDHYPAAATQENMEKFLDDVKEERISSKGGYSMWAIVKRFISEMLMSLMVSVVRLSDVSHKQKLYVSCLIGPRDRVHTLVNVSKI